MKKIVSILSVFALLAILVMTACAAPPEEPEWVPENHQLLHLKYNADGGWWELDMGKNITKSGYHTHTYSGIEYSVSNVAYCPAVNVTDDVVVIDAGSCHQ